MTSAAANGFRRIDLHILTPSSACSVDSIKPEANRRAQAVEGDDAARAAGPDGIAIVYRNGAEMIDPKRAIAVDCGRIVVGGAECSTRPYACLRRPGHLFAKNRRRGRLKRVGGGPQAGVRAVPGRLSQRRLLVR